MDSIECLPDAKLNRSKIISKHFIELGLKTLKQAAYYLKDMEYGYNSIEYPLILFKEQKGTCATKHAIFALCAVECGVKVHKTLGIYKMTDEIVTGVGSILGRYKLPYMPYIHCFLTYKDFRVDLTEGNCNGKNKSVEEFIYIERVKPNISSYDQNEIYLKVLNNIVLFDMEMKGIKIKTILKAKSRINNFLMDKFMCLARA
jgi:hypothetical protein